MRMLFCTPLLCCAILVCFADTNNPERDLSEFFGGREGCFVVYDPASVTFTRYNPNASEERFSPCSTFKIPHTLVALETGVASGADFTLRWDGFNRGGPAW